MNFFFKKKNSLNTLFYAYSKTKTFETSFANESLNMNNSDIKLLSVFIFVNIIAFIIDLNMFKLLKF